MQFPSKISFVFFAGMLSFVLLASACSKPAGQKEIDAGLRELRRDNYVRAKSFFEKAIARRPGHVDNAMAHNYLGITAWRLGQFQEAVTAFEDSRRLNPNLIEPVYNLGVLAGERDDMRSASRYLNEAAGMNREDPRPLEYLADLYFQRDQFIHARNSLYTALDRAPRSARIYHSIGLVHAAMEQPAQAIEAFMYALEIDTRHAPSLFNLAVVYDMQVGDADQARAFYKRFISAVPRDERVPIARSALARLDQSGTIKSQAESGEIFIPPSEDLTAEVTPPAAPTAAPVATPTVTPRVETTAVRESPYDAMLRQAEERARAGQLQPAIDLYVRAAELAAGDRQVELQEKAYREAVRVALDQPRAHVLLGQHLFERGRFDQAARSFNQAATLNANYAPAQVGLARISLQNKDFETAMVRYRNALASDPRNADAAWELAVLYDRNLELPESAARTYREFAAAFPGDSRASRALTRAETLAPTPGAGNRPAPLRPRETSTVRQLDYRPPTTRNTDAAVQSFRRADTYRDQKDWDRAVYFYLRSLENDDQIAGTFYNLGICYAMKGENELARAAYHHALRLNADMVDAQYNLALLYREAGDDATAVRMLEDVVGKRPNYAVGHYALGVIFSGKPETTGKARQHYERFLALAPNDPSAPAIRAWISGR